MIHTNLCRNVRLVRFEPGRLEFRTDEHAPRDLASKVGHLLGEWTGRRWVVTVSSEPGEPSLAAQAEAARRREVEAAAAHPLVQAAQKAFPGARITRVTPAGRGVALDAEVPGVIDDEAMDADDDGVPALIDEDPGGRT